MANIHIYLTLVGFFSADVPYLQPATNSSYIAPVHQSIYGGYVLYAGAEFSVNDFDEPDVFAGKIANMFMFGAQMGWFSLIGRDNEKPNMGIYHKFMDPKHDQEIFYLNILSSAK
jgi:hypothetical protein